MTGTSIDAVDGALVDIRGVGLDLTVRLVECVTQPIGDEGDVLRAAAAQAPVRVADLVEAVRVLSLRHAALAQQLVRRHGPVDLIAAHGQTLTHHPPTSWQAIEPWTMAHAAGAPVVFDLRAADLAAGGQGAPITPLADWILFWSAECSRAVVNLGGFCNVTLLQREARPEHVSGFDVCACNQLLDAVARQSWGAPYDEDGARALAGSINVAACEALTNILRRQREAKRSLGTGDEAGEWIEQWRQALSPNDLAATAASAIGQVIGEAIAGADEALLAGGGSRNAALTRAIEQSCGARLRTTDELGVPASHREAVCMAALGALCQDRIPITLPQVTGAAAAPIAGSWANLHA